MIEFDHLRPRAEAPLPDRSLLIAVSGLSGSGKSTLARLLVERLRTERPVYHLDRVADHAANMAVIARYFDAPSTTLASHGPTQEFELTEGAYRRLLEIVGSFAAHLVRHGVTVVSSLISPYRVVGERLREAVGVDRFVGVFVSTPLRICEARDCRGMYSRARSGELSFLPGISSPYEAPSNPAVIVDSSGHTPPEVLVESILVAVNRARATQ
ncbi:MAG: adenylyl-sulfate kinase [Kofleriaceae bacterium]